MPNNKNLNSVIIGTSIVILIFAVISGCFGDDDESDYKIAKIKEAYCDLDGNFHFTIVNLKSEEINLKYKWTLNDPMSDNPSLEGEGSVILQGKGEKNLTFSIPSGLRDYDARFYIMYVYLYEGGEKIYEYREQKSDYDWDYSVLPPVKYDERQEHVYVSYETFVSINDRGDFKVQFENVSYNPSNGQFELKLSEFYAYIFDRIDWHEQEEWRTSDILAPANQGQESPVFYDADGDNTISNYDYYIVPQNLIKDLEHPVIEFETACSYFYKKGWFEEGLEEEDRDAIIIKEITVIPENPTKLDGLEVIVKVQSKKRISQPKIYLELCDGGGKNEVFTDFQEVSMVNFNYTYSLKITDTSGKNPRECNEAFVYINLGHMLVDERFVAYKVL